MSSVTQAGMSGIVSLAAAPKSVSPVADPTKIHDAAQQFEGLLLAQILHSSHDPESGWMGSGGDSSSACATDYAEEQLAATMARQGGFGLGKLITAGLEREAAAKSH